MTQDREPKRVLTIDFHDFNPKVIKQLVKQTRKMDAEGIDEAVIPITIGGAPLFAHFELLDRGCQIVLLDAKSDDPFIDVDHRIIIETPKGPAYGELEMFLKSHKTKELDVFRVVNYRFMDAPEDWSCSFLGERKSDEDELDGDFQAALRAGLLEEY